MNFWLQGKNYFPWIFLACLNSDLIEDQNQNSSVGFQQDMDICKASGSNSDTACSKQVESEHAVFSCICSSNFRLFVRTQRLIKKTVIKFFFFRINSITNFLDAQVFDLLLWLCPVVVDLLRWFNMTKLKEPKDFFI